jgi:hypothetical protein
MQAPYILTCRGAEKIALLHDFMDFVVYNYPWGVTCIYNSVTQVLTITTCASISYVVNKDKI